MRLALPLAAAVAAIALGLSGSAPARAGCSPNRVYQDAGPRWSPDGALIAFYRVEIDCAPAPTGIYVVHADGTGLRRIGNGVSHGPPSPPAWAPDGRLLAFASPDGIVIAEARGPGLDELTHLRGDVAPAWSPDGRWIVFRRAGHVWVTTPDGTQLHQFVGAHGRAVPVWAPDSRRFAFIGPGSRSSEDVYVAEVGSPLTARNLTPGPEADWAPAWSPDGRTLAYESGPVGERHIYRVDIDGTGLARLTTGQGSDHDPAWSPDGAELAYVGLGEPRDRVRLLDLASGASRVLVDHESDLMRDPAWSPDGSAIAFAAGGTCGRYGIHIQRRSGSDERRLSNPCDFRGTPGADVLRGTPFFDRLLGLAGRDRLIALAGDDRLAGGGGADVLDAGVGADTLVAGPGDDLLVGGPNDDHVVPGPGRDRVFGGDGDDRVFTRDGRRDSVDCGTGSRDQVVADRVDRVAHNCERVAR